MHTLVLGAAGPIGGAWLGGLAAGLADGGLPLAAVTQVVGTSVGAVLGAWLGNSSGPDNIDGFVEAMADRAAWHAARGRAAPPDHPPADLASFWADRLPPGPWPVALRIAAVGTGSGRIGVWSAQDRIPLGAALAAATSPPGVLPPVRITNRLYVDGAVRSPTNADLAVSRIDEDGARVLVLAPVVSSALYAEIALLRRLGCAVSVITPDRGQVVEAPGAFRTGVPEATLVRPAARVGCEQAAHALSELPLGMTAGAIA